MSKLEAAQDWAADVVCQWEQIPQYQVDSQRLRHLAVICDGNRRAAINTHFEPHLGHLVGLEVNKGIATACRSWGIRCLTLWVWSTDNWKRDKDQTSFIMNLAEERLSHPDFLEELIENETRFTHLGRKDRIPESLLRTLESLETATDGLTKYSLNLGLDYGGKDEIERAAQRRILSCGEGELTDYLDTVGQPPVDLVIRTGVKGSELPHTSGFMPLQTIDAAWIFMPDLFPDLTPNRLLQSIQKFDGYKKRMGR